MATNIILAIIGVIAIGGVGYLGYALYIWNRILDDSEEEK